MVVRKHEEEDARMAKKMRANWTLPTMNQEIPTSINMMIPMPSAEEMHLLKEINGQVNGTMTPEEQAEKKRTFRMVNHFGKKPPMMPNSTTNVGVKSRNQGQKSMHAPVSMHDKGSATGTYNIKLNRDQFETIDEEVASRNGRHYATLQNAAESIISNDRKGKNPNFGGPGTLTPDNQRVSKKGQYYSSSGAGLVQSQTRLPLQNS